MKLTKTALKLLIKEVIEETGPVVFPSQGSSRPPVFSSKDLSPGTDRPPAGGLPLKDFLEKVFPNALQNEISTLIAGRPEDRLKLIKTLMSKEERSDAQSVIVPTDPGVRGFDDTVPGVPLALAPTVKK